MEEKLKEFLKELTELSIKHNFVIGGCGCCGSPWIDLADGTKTDFEELYFDKENKVYRVYYENGDEVKL